MAKIENTGGILDPVMYGEMKMSRRTKGTPFTNGGTGFNLEFNRLPPGLDIANQETGMDLMRIVDMDPCGPITSSAESY